MFNKNHSIVFKTNKLDYTNIHIQAYDLPLHTYIFI